jgi:2-C-methyl-D-erythritol 4-phosphate cytidylyltransferase
MTDKDSLSVIISGGGRGNRYGRKKQFETVLGHPIIILSARPFLLLSELLEVIFVVPEDDVDLMSDFIKNDERLNGSSKIIPGGKERQDSVYEGLKIAKGKYIAVHDAVRPLITTHSIEECYELAERKGACIIANKSFDTVKRVDEERKILNTIDRNRVFFAETPQIFRKNDIIKAYESAYKEGFYGTDEASLVEKYNLTDIYVIEPERINLKVTVKSDLHLVENLLKDELF